MIRLTLLHILLLLARSTYFSILPAQELQLKTISHTKQIVEIIELTVHCNNITLVNVNDEILLKNLHRALRFNFINRNFWSVKIEIYNEAYLISTKDYSELNNGLYDLQRDFFWNPKAVFVIIFQELTEDDMTKMFQDLHDLYVFDVYIISENNAICFIYTYDFDKSARCSFTKTAIIRKKCEEGKINIKPKLNGSPYSGCKNLTFLVIPIIPNTYTDKDGASSKKIGFEEVFYTIMQEMGYFNFTFMFADEDETIGLLTANYTATGVMKQVQDGIADGIFGGMLMSRSRIGIFDFVYPHGSDELIMLVPRATALEKWKAMFLTFTSVVWTLIVFSFIMFYIAAVKLKIFGKSRARDNAYMILRLFGYFVGTTHKHIENKSTSVRFMVISWAIFTWLIVCFYQSNLASVFTKPTFYHQVNSLEEMIQQKFHLHLYKRTSSYMKATKAFDFGDLMNRIIVVDSIEESLDAVASIEKAGTVASQVLFDYHKAAYLDASYRPKLHVLNPTIAHVYLSAYIKKGHPDLEKLRFLERQIISGYFHRKQMNKLVFEMTLLHRYNSSSFANALRLKNIEGLYYYVLMIGCILSLLVFSCEVLSKKLQKT